MYPGAGGTGGMMGGQQGAGQMLGQGMVMPSQMLGGMPIMDMSAFGGVDMSQLSGMVGGAVPIMPMGSTAAGLSGMGGMPAMAGMPGMMPGMGGMGGGMGMVPGGGDDNTFYKTRICHKWQEGKCNFGPGCRYAHGEADLRPSVGNAGGGGRAASAPRAMGGGSGGAGAKAGPNVEVHKTRLCERFMSTGMCPYLAKCTFAHGHEELRQPGQMAAVQGAVGGGRSAPLVVPTNPQGGVMMGGAAGPVIGPTPRPGGGGMDGGAGTKRRRMDGGGGSEFVVPPEYELLPAEGSGTDLAWLQQRFQALKNEINAFAAETGHSVAVFTIGGLVSSDPDTPADDSASEAIIRAAPSASRPSLKLSVLKYGSGGVARQLVQRQEIVKFVCARGGKALAELGDREADPHLAGL